MTIRRPGGHPNAARALLATLTLAACKSPPAPTANPVGEAGATRSSVPARWVHPRPPVGLSLLEAPAEVLTPPDAEGVVVAPMAARVTRVFVRAGQAVDKGAPVVAVVMPQVVAAAGAFAAARTRFDAYKARRDQLEQLRAEGLARSAETAEVGTKLAEAKADQQAALATLRAGGLDPADVPSLLDQSGTATLRSPVAGVVLEVDATVGELREPGGKPFVRIAGEGAPRIEARLAHELPTGATYTFVSAGGGTHAVRLLQRAPVVDPRDGTATCWFEPEDAALLLPRGLGGRLRVALDEKSGVLAVPAAAVALDAGRALVTVRAGNSEKHVPVVVLATSGADALVRGELTVADEVSAEARPAPAGAAE